MNLYKLTKVVEFIKSRFASLIFSFVIFVGFFLISEILVRAETQKEEAKTKIAAADYASALKTKVDRELNALLFISNGLSSYLTVYHEHLDDKKVMAILADLYARTQLVKNLAIAIGYKITYIYPSSANKNALGVDFRDVPDQWPQVEQAVESHQGVLAGPVDLLQGGRGLIYRYPIYIDGEYWGILSTVINTDAFFEAAFSQLPNDEYYFSIRPKGSSDVFFGDANLFHHPNALITVSDFPNAQWEWAILQKTEQSSGLLLINRMMGIVISLLLAILAYFFSRERVTLTSQAMHDSLTGLANRRLLEFRLAQTLAQAKRFKLVFSVILVDIDHFKTINDTYGHEVGDEILKEVAKRLHGCIRDVDTLARLGGDEFVIVLDELKQPEDAIIIASKLIGLFDHKISVMGHHIKISLSAGVAINDQHKDETLKHLIKKADIALYEAKGTGRNCYKIFSEV